MQDTTNKPMKIFASTTFLGDSQTYLAEPLSMLSELDLDGVELGSTHFWQADLGNEISKFWDKPILTHNYFPASPHNLVLNIASSDPDIRKSSIEHMKYCIQFASEIGATLYTIHPGFLAEPLQSKANIKEKSFDFSFSTEFMPYEKAFSLMKDALVELIEVANKFGVRLAIETEGSLTSSGVTLMEEPKEYDRLFEEIPNDLYLTMNLAHTSLAAQGKGFEISPFINRFKDRIAAVEISHNDGFRDQHRPLKSGCSVLNWIPYLPDVPLILEFRCATQTDVANSIAILRDIERNGINS